jgi:hypothetical protein
MTGARDPDRLIRAFLDEGRTELADRVYDAVRSDIDRTRQRVVIGPWREPRMSTIARLAIALAAVLLLAVAGAYVGSRRSDQVAVPPVPPTVAPTPVPTPLVYDWPAPLAAGTYTTNLVWRLESTMSFTVPAGWEGRDIEIRKDPVMLIGFSPIKAVYADACQKTALDPLGDGIGGVIDAVSAIPGVHATPAVPVSFAGLPARTFAMTIDDAIGCSLESAMLWSGDPERVSAGKPFAGPDWPASYPNHKVWIVGLGSVRWAIDAAWADTATTADRAELQAIVDSIGFTPDGGAVPDCSVTMPTSLTLGMPLSDMLGMAPSPLPSLARPLAQVNFSTRGSNWASADGGPFRPTISLIGPSGTNAGFATVTPVNGLQGSLVLDGPGVWLAELSGVNLECPHIFLFDVRAP